MEIFFDELDISVARSQEQAKKAMFEIFRSIQIAKTKIKKFGESITDGFFVLDREWRFTYLNHQAEKLWRRPRGELLGKVVWDEYPILIGSEIYNQYHYAVENQSDVHFETFGPVLEIWEEIHAYPSSEGLLILFRDITTIRESQAYMRLVKDVVNSSQDAIITGNLEGMITSWNPGAENILGYSATEVIGRNLGRFINSDKVKDLPRLLRRIKNKEVINEFYEHYRDHNSVVLTSASVFPLYESDGQAKGFATIMRDTTEHWHIEQELQHFFDISLDIMIICDYSGRITRANRALTNILGFAMEDVIGQPATRFIVPEYLPGADLQYRHMIKSNSPIRGYELPCYHADGSSRLLQWNMVPVASRRCYYAVARDITDQRRLEKDLAKSNRRSNKILESIKDGFFALDKQWKVTYVNHVARAMVSYEVEKVLGCNLWDIFPGGEESVVYKQFHNAVRQQIPLNFECWVNAVKGWYEFNIYPTSNGGLLVYFYDLSEVINSRQQLQRLERLQLVSQMAAGISHEIRNPLTTVRGFLQVLYENNDFIEHQPYFEVMIDELDRANTIISEFLDLAKDKPNYLKPVNINRALERLQPLIEANLKEHRLVIEASPIPELMLNEGEIRQLILNLVNNAAEAMQEPGCITITTSMKGSEVIFSVSDEGYGIPPEYMDKIGTPFFTTKNKGTGLGLATCFSIAKRHGARIQIHSSTEGTVVMVCFEHQGVNDSPQM